MLPPEQTYCYEAELVRVVDGDTLDCKIDLGFNMQTTQRVRLSSVNAPEPRGAEAVAGKWVGEKVRSWFGGEKDLVLKSNSYEPDKYGRCLANVWCMGVSLNNWLLYEKWVWGTDDNGSIIGPRSIDLLALPDQIKAEVRRQQQL